MGGRLRTDMEIMQMGRSKYSSLSIVSLFLFKFFFGIVEYFKDDIFRRDSLC